jgi:hypothetical protein
VAGPAPARPTPAAAAADKLLAGYIGKRPGAEAALAAEGPEAVAAVRRGLRSPSESARWAALEFACRHPRPEFGADLLDFLARWGPRSHDGRMIRRLYDDVAPVVTNASLCKLLKSYGECLPEAERIAFFVGAGAAMPYDYRECGTLVSPYTTSCDPARQTAAARVFRGFCERGDNRVDVLAFTGWQMYAGADPALRDPRAAEQYILRALEALPGDVHLRVILGVIGGKLAEARRAAEACPDASALNAVAWKLSMIAKPTPEQSGLAMLCARRALKLAGTASTGYPYFLDTLAAVQSAAGEHGQALETQRKAVHFLPADSKSRTDFLRREVLYLARSAAPAGERPASIGTIRGERARDALLARLGEAPPGDEFRPVLVEVLRRCFGTDPLVVKRLGKEAPGGPEGPHPEVF